MSRTNCHFHSYSLQCIGNVNTTCKPVFDFSCISNTFSHTQKKIIKFICNELSLNFYFSRILYSTREKKENLFKMKKMTPRRVTFLPRKFGRSSPVAILFRGTVARAWDLFDTRDEFSTVMCFADFCLKWLTKNPHMAGEQRKGIYFNVYFLSKCWHSLNVNYYNIWYNFPVSLVYFVYPI